MPDAFQIQLVWLERGEEAQVRELGEEVGGEKIMSGPGSHCTELKDMGAKESFEQRTDHDHRSTLAADPGAS